MPEICCSLKVTIFFKALFLKTVLGNLFLHFHGTQLYCRSFPSLVQWVCLFYIPICCCLWRVGEAWEMPETSILCIITLEARPLQAGEVLEGKKRGLCTETPPPVASFHHHPALQNEHVLFSSSIFFSDAQGGYRGEAVGKIIDCTLKSWHCRF